MDGFNKVALSGPKSVTAGTGADSASLDTQSATPTTTAAPSNDQLQAQTKVHSPLKKNSNDHRPLLTVKRYSATSSIVVPVSGNVQSTAYLHKSKRGFPQKDDVNSTATSVNTARTHWRTSVNDNDNLKNKGDVGQKEVKEEYIPPTNEKRFFHDKLSSMKAKLDTVLKDSSLSSSSPSAAAEPGAKSKSQPRSISDKNEVDNQVESQVENQDEHQVDSQNDVRNADLANELHQLQLDHQGSHRHRLPDTADERTFITAKSCPTATDPTDSTPVSNPGPEIDLNSLDSAAGVVKNSIPASSLYKPWSSSSMSSSNPASPLLCGNLNDANITPVLGNRTTTMEAASASSSETSPQPPANVVNDYTSRKNSSPETCQNSKNADLSNSNSSYSSRSSGPDQNGSFYLKSQKDPQRLALSSPNTACDCSHNATYPSRICTDSEKLYTGDDELCLPSYLNSRFSVPPSSSSSHYFESVDSHLQPESQLSLSPISTMRSTSSATQLVDTSSARASPAPVANNYVLTSSASPPSSTSSSAMVNGKTKNIYASSNKSCSDIANNSAVTITLSGSPDLSQTSRTHFDDADPFRTDTRSAAANTNTNTNTTTATSSFSSSSSTYANIAIRTDSSATGSDSDLDKGADSETSTERPGRDRRTSSMVRKKSGELVKPSLKLMRHHSLPSSPSKAVHFDTNLVSVRRFRLGERPIAVSSADNSPTSEPVTFHWHDDDTESESSGDDSDTNSRASYGLFSGFSKKKAYEWSIQTPNFTASPQTLNEFRNEHRMVFLDKLFLSSDKNNLIGHIYVKNICYSKSVSIRFSVDYWKTVTEVFAEFNNDITQQPPAPKPPVVYLPQTKQESLHALMNTRDRSNSIESVTCQTSDVSNYDRFTFVLRLQDLPQHSLLHNSMFFCIRYQANGAEYWDNNNCLNYQVNFRKVPKGSSNGSSGGNESTNQDLASAEDQKPNLIIKGTNRVQTRRRTSRHQRNHQGTKSHSLLDSGKLESESSGNDAELETTNIYGHRRSKTAYAAPFNYDVYGDYDVDDSDFADLRGYTSRANRNSDFVFSNNTHIHGSSKNDSNQTTNGSPQNGNRTAGQVKAKKKLTSRYSFGASWNDLFSKNHPSNMSNGEYSESESETGGLKKLVFPTTSRSMPSATVPNTATTGAYEDPLLSTSTNPDVRPAWDSTLYQDIIKKYCFFKEPPSPSPSLSTSVGNDNSSAPNVDANITAAPTVGVIRRDDSGVLNQNRRPVSTTSGFSLEESMSRSSKFYSHNDNQIPKVPGEITTPKSSSPSLHPGVSVPSASPPRAELNELKV